MSLGGEGKGSGVAGGICHFLLGVTPRTYVHDLPGAALQSEGPSSGIICFNLFFP